MLVFGHFFEFITISRRSENHKFSRGRFFLFGPGRARREQPNAGLHLGVRAFVRSVSHVKVLVASLFGLFLKVYVPHWGDERRQKADHGGVRTPQSRGASEMAIAWVQCGRGGLIFPGARALGGSSTWRRGGLSGRQLTGPVAEAPEVDLRSSAASRHQAELGV